ncbi:Metallo-beta-lactamase family protein [Fulvivirga imtechensis AK7]|uniref:Metallo-beta-lactamase family protein n=1 Tax=Fulvivirga imtechensis AK7 TaxID=1237149 RepID=L8JQZ5_9BACT|nr:MBL fold metallo-hydrolase [Fulvivirga imtechensis]ELR71270.1 Metallo-beta-lactamase family protein [Fulvivirga imtechensis AK7]
MHIEQLYTNCLAEAAYYIESEGEVAIIDPLRETKPYLQIAAERGAEIKYIFETHFHADFVSGHIDLSHQTGAKIIYGPNADTDYEIYQAKDGEVFQLGKITLQALHTPGHTPESTCYLLKDEQGKDYAIFTGDTLFVGDVGRPDLLDGVMTKEELAGMMYDSLNSKIKPLADNVIVYPAHGPGSACGKNIGKETFSTIGVQKKMNYALQDMSKEEFIDKVTDGMLPPPKYFFEDARINKSGYQPIETVISKNKSALDTDKFKQYLNDGALILDTRMPGDFEKGFIKGSINIGLNGQYAVWVGTLININDPLILVTEPGKEEEAVLRLARIGYENVKGFLKGGIEAWVEPLERIQSIEPEKVASRIKKGSVVLDVRKHGEFNTAHIKDALFITLAEMPDNLSGLDKEKDYLVHCAGGYRSMIAASIMKKEGFKNPINVYGGFGAIQQTNIGIESEVVDV